MKFIVSITDNGCVSYIAPGKNYKVNNETYVCLTTRIGEERRYKTRSAAEKAANRRGANMYGIIEILEVSL